MEPNSSEQNPDEEHENWVRVTMKESGEHFMTQIRESALSVLKLAVQLENYDNLVELMDKSSKKEIFELKNKLAALLEDSVKKEKELKLKEEKFMKVVEEREKKVLLGEVSLKERLRLFHEKEKESDLKQLLEGVVMRLVLEMHKEETVSQLNVQENLLRDSMKQKHEKLMRELEARKQKVDLLSKFTDEQHCELKRKVTDFDLKQMVKTSRIREEAELNVKKLEARENELEKKELKQKEEAKLLELKEKKLDERERKIKIKEASVQAETPSLLAEKVRETDDSLIPPAKRHKLIGEHNAERETYSDPASEERRREGDTSRAQHPPIRFTYKRKNKAQHPPISEKKQSPKGLRSGKEAFSG